MRPGIWSQLVQDSLSRFRIRWQGVSITFVIVLVSPNISDANEPLLERDVLPILTKQCMGCHGGLKQEGSLDLRTLPSILKGGESGSVVKPGQVKGSILWKKIAANEMPPGKTKLTTKEKEILRRWIGAGLPTVASRRSKQAAPLLPARKKHQPQQVAGVIDQHINRELTSSNLNPDKRRTVRHTYQCMKRTHGSPSLFNCPFDRDRNCNGGMCS